MHVEFGLVTKLYLEHYTRRSIIFMYAVN